MQKTRYFRCFISLMNTLAWANEVENDGGKTLFCYDFDENIRNIIPDCVNYVSMDMHGMYRVC